MSGIPDGERRARIALTAITEPGHPRLLRDVARLGAGEVLAMLEAGEHPLATTLRARLSGFDLGRELAAAERVGARYVAPGDPEWPAQIEDLVDVPELHDRGGMPIGLWVRGPARLDVAAQRSVSIVGSRSSTTYGAQIAADLAAEVTDAGYAVVSGAAFGIDQSAHRGCLARAGTTIAALACGIDRVYPESHRTLIERIGAEGLLISEAGLGAAPMRIRFLARNRLIAALSPGTVVVEAAIRSGALNTASWAEGLNRVVMGVPGPITSEASHGVHELIRARGALLVTTGAEVLEAIAPIGEWTLPIPREPARLRDLLTSEQRQVLDAVPVARPAPLVRIVRTAGLQPERVAEAMVQLEEAGLVAECDGRWHVTMRANAE